MGEVYEEMRKLFHASVRNYDTDRTTDRMTNQQRVHRGVTHPKIEKGICIERGYPPDGSLVFSPETGEKEDQHLH